jgi:hypothetical protein
VQQASPLPATAAKKSGRTLKIVLIVAAAVIAVVVLAIGTVGYLGWRALHSGGNNMAMGQAANVSEADLGVSIYPGAVPNANGASRMHFGGLQTVTAMYSTGDPVSSVVSYYQEKLGPGATSSESNGATVLTETSTAGSTKDNIIVSVKSGQQASGPTGIVIVHMKTDKQ